MLLLPIAKEIEIDRNLTGKYVAIANVLQLEADQCHTSRSRLFCGKFCTAHAHKLLYRSFRSKF